MTALVIINYNGYEDTKECLESIEKANHDTLSIIVVDNASTDDSYEQLKLLNQNIPFHLIKTERNGGFAYANNIGINYAFLELQCENVILLNNDTVVEHATFTNLIQSKYNDGNTIIAGKSYYFHQPQKIWFDGGVFNPWKARSDHKSGGESFLTFCFVLIPKQVIDKVGLLNEEYFMYVEDMEYCYRATKSGVDLKVEPSSHIWHKVGSSSGGQVSPFTAYWITRNKVKFIKEQLPWYQKISALAYLLLSRARLIFWLIEGKFDLIKGQLRGLKDGFFS